MLSRGRQLIVIPIALGVVGFLIPFLMLWLYLSMPGDDRIRSLAGGLVFSLTPTIFLVGHQGVDGMAVLLNGPIYAAAGFAALHLRGLFARGLAVGLLVLWLVFATWFGMLSN